MQEPNVNPFKKYDDWRAQQKTLPWWRRVPPWWMSAISLLGVILRVAVNPIGGWTFAILNGVFGLYLVWAITMDLPLRRQRKAMAASAVT